MLLRLKRRGYVPRSNEKNLPAAGVSAKGVTIAQPRNAPSRPNRTKAYKAKGSNDDEVVNTFVPNTNSVQDSHFMSGGYGSPYSHNRKQKTLSQDKSSLSQVNTAWVQSSAYAKGYITKSQSKLQANTGSMDRLGRLKAKSIANSKTNPLG